ncbi:hypothetical protein B0H16DRAFT_1589022 [Mycena metata]|uniref:F-box domain-containing protein n=1 Tax=Mycena metata TaxID=1033252 RepID=A0AAD7MQJ6_9AGAR|nr:hypothetical protein B0H16DRAFT_733242 [Mycena metata]KAJ7728338.1 hypothetical protein B0H16DRAFT_1589022 [Mycena metata]
MVPHLPQELIEAIVEEVPSESLAACSLTAIAFVACSQRRLFRWMSLSDIPAYERAARLLASSPHLGPYFRYLDLDLKEVPQDYCHLESILAGLSEIEFLAISGDYDGYDRSSSNQIGDQPSLIDFLSLATLRCLALFGLVDVPASLVARAFSLFEEILLSLITIANDEDQDSESSSSPTALWHIGVSTDSDESVLAFLLHPKRIRSLHHLQRLSVVFPPIPDSRQHRFEELLFTCSENLDSLELELETSPTYIPTLPVLTRLQLWLDVALTKTPAELHSIIAATIASTPHLEVLTLAFLDRDHLRQTWTDRRPEALADLDSAFVDMRDLREVGFSMRWFYHRPERYAAFTSFIEACFPRTFAAGLVRFSYQSSASQHPMDIFASIS